MNRIDDIKRLLDDFNAEREALAASMSSVQQCERCQMYRAALHAFDGWDFSGRLAIEKASKISRRLYQYNVKLQIYSKWLKFNVLYRNVEMKSTQAVLASALKEENYALHSILKTKQAQITDLQKRLSDEQTQNDRVEKENERWMQEAQTRISLFREALLTHETINDCESIFSFDGSSDINGEVVEEDGSIHSPNGCAAATNLLETAEYISPGLSKNTSCCHITYSESSQGSPPIENSEKIPVITDGDTQREPQVAEPENSPQGIAVPLDDLLLTFSDF